MRIANKDARKEVANRWEFKGANTRREWIGHEAHTGYVVYSYGRHWPLFIWFDGVWYGNADRYSVATSKHRSQLHPLAETMQRSNDEMKAIRDQIEAENMPFAKVS